MIFVTAGSEIADGLSFRPNKETLLILATLDQEALASSWHLKARNGLSQVWK